MIAALTLAKIAQTVIAIICISIFILLAARSLP